MSRHRGCITDRLAREYWQAYLRDGTSLGLSFVEYVAARVNADKPMETYTSASSGPWYVAACGHTHPWGSSCAENTTV